MVRNLVTFVCVIAAGVAHGARVTVFGETFQSDWAAANDSQVGIAGTTEIKSSPNVYGFLGWTGDLSTNFGFGPVSQSWEKLKSDNVNTFRMVQESETLGFMRGTKWDPSGTWLMGCIECGASLKSQWGCGEDSDCKQRAQDATPDCTNADPSTAAKRAVNMVKEARKKNVHLAWLQVNHVDSMNPTENPLVNPSDSKPHMRPATYGKYVGTIYRALRDLGGEVPLLALPWQVRDEGWTDFHSALKATVGGGKIEMGYSTTTYPYWMMRTNVQESLACMAKASCGLSFVALQKNVEAMVKSSGGDGVEPHLVVTETAWARFCNHPDAVNGYSTEANQCQYVDNLIKAPLPPSKYFVAFWMPIVGGMCCKIGGPNTCTGNGGLQLYKRDDLTGASHFGKECSNIKNFVARRREGSVAQTQTGDVQKVQFGGQQQRTQDSGRQQAVGTLKQASRPQRAGGGQQQANGKVKKAQHIVKGATSRPTIKPKQNKHYPQAPSSVKKQRRHGRRGKGQSFQLNEARAADGGKTRKRRMLRRKAVSRAR